MRKPGGETGLLLFLLFRDLLRAVTGGSLPQCWRIADTPFVTSVGLGAWVARSIQANRTSATRWPALQQPFHHAPGMAAMRPLSDAAPLRSGFRANVRKVRSDTRARARVRARGGWVRGESG
jgi:hypothetical protein